MSSTYNKITSDRIMELNLLTNILTVVLFIAFAVTRRIHNNREIMVVLAVSFILNSILTVYLLYRYKLKFNKDAKKLNSWIITRIIANIGFAVMSIYLILK